MRYLYGWRLVCFKWEFLQDAGQIVAGGDSGGAFLQEDMGWDSQTVVKRSDHAEAEWAFAIKDF
jgi:hypothetical protein